MRVPTPTGSLVDFVASVDRTPGKSELIDAFEEAAAGPMRGYLDVSHEPLVSTDYVGNPHSSVLSTRWRPTWPADLVKVITWYDNEWGYSCRTADLTKFVGDRL